MIEFDFSDIFTYINKDSIIHKLDARIKIAIFFILLITTFLLHSLRCLSLLYILLIIFIFLSKIHIKHFIKPLKSILLLIFITVILNIFFITNGKVIFQYYIFKITNQGLYISLSLFMRITLLILFSYLLTLTTSLVKITYAIEYFLTKLGKWTHPYEVAIMITIAIRFMPVLIKEFIQILKAQVSRGANIYTSSIFERIKIIVSIIVPLLMRAFNTAENLAIAMETRGFGISDHSKYLNRYKLTYLDLIIFFLTITFITLIILIDKNILNLPLLNH